MVLAVNVVFLSSIVVTFATLLVVSKSIVRRYFSHIDLLRDYDAATDLMELNVILAFVVGLVLSVGALVYFDSLKPKATLSPTEWQKFPLVEKKTLSPNTALYRFRLPKPNAILGLPIGQHISVQADVNGKTVMRSYTPTSSDEDKGHFDLVVKAYEQGNVSKYIGNMKIGDLLTVKGPKGQMRYQPGLARAFGMIAGGTGLTPCLQIIRAVLSNPNDKTQIDFIYANVNEQDILLREELDQLAKEHKDRFRIHYFLNNPPEGWNGGVGFVTKEAIEQNLPKSANDIKILMCGPPPMISAMKKHLGELGYPAPRAVSKLEDQVFCF